MTKDLKRLYKEYDVIQGKNPFYIGSKLMSRIDCRHYSLRTMRAVVSLLKMFAEKYDRERNETIEKYSLYFQFYRRPSIKTFLFIVDNNTNEILDVYSYMEKDRLGMVENKDNFEIINRYPRRKFT